jgi:transposase
MDTHTLVEPQQASRKRRFPTALKIQIVEETFEPGNSMSLVARRHDINTNQLFAWRRLYRNGMLGQSSKLLPVRVEPEIQPATDVDVDHGSMLEIFVSNRRIKAVGLVDGELLRIAIEALK